MLTERQQLILHALIDNYIRSAEPVGSRTISKREEIAYSSATIRNEMADLEEHGYIEQPHTSAGRIPSNKGYRFYVDQLVKAPFTQPADIIQMRQLFAERFYELEQVMNQAAGVLSSLTNYTSIILGHEINHTKLKHLQLLPISDSDAVVILVTDTGKVESKKINIPEEISRGELERVVNLLNEKLIGVPMNELRDRLTSEVARELGRFLKQYQQMIAVLEETLTQPNDERIVMKGASKIMMQPEFRDVDKARDILTLFEQNDMVVRLFDSHKTGVQVRIGTENNEEAVSNCSIITATYHLNGLPVGTLGILGPTRMEYGRVIGILDGLATNLSELLSHLYKTK